MKLFYLIISAIFIFFASLFFDNVETLTHSLMNFFAGGRSPIRVYLFIAYLILLSILFLLSKNKNNDKRISKITSILLIVLVAVYFIGFFTHYIIYNILDVPLSDYLVFFSGDEITTTKITHNHFFKAVIGSLFYFLGISSFDNMDPGLSVLNFLNPFLVFIIAILVILVILLFLYLFYLLKDKNKDRPILFILIYSLLSFILIKNIFDGGLFYESTLLSFLLFITIVFYNKSNLFYLYFIIPFLLSGIFYHFGFLNSFEEFRNILLKQLAFLLFFIPFVYLIRKKTKINNKLFYLLLIQGSILFSVFVLSDVSKMLYKYEKMFKEGSYLVSYNYDDKYSVVEKINNLYIYKIYPDEETKIVNDVLKRHNILENLYPVGVPWSTCIPTSSPINYSFIISTKESIEIEDLKGKYVSFMISDSVYKRNRFHYSVDLYTKPCINRSLNIIESIFSEEVDDFVMYNFKQK